MNYVRMLKNCILQRFQLVLGGYVQKLFVFIRIVVYEKQNKKQGLPAWVYTLTVA